MGNVVNRVFDSSGPEGKVRGTPQQIIDKYNQLACDAQLAGDRVATENFQQHVEHYLRLLSEAQKEQDQKREEQERQNRERQAERDRERADRQERDSSGGETPAEQPGTNDQSDVLDNDARESDSGLVETPENKTEDTPPAKPKWVRRPRKKPESDGSGGSDSSGNSDSSGSSDSGDAKGSAAAAE